MIVSDEIEEELAPLIEAQEVKKVETYEEQVNRAKEGAQDLGWIHFLGEWSRTAGLGMSCWYLL